VHRYTTEFRNARREMSEKEKMDFKKGSRYSLRLLHQTA
jgi:hypothetical protein